jgi:hypothetical protein
MVMVEKVEVEEELIEVVVFVVMAAFMSIVEPMVRRHA